jgi:tetratricopeptide (TPR) repeat protein
MAGEGTSSAFIGRAVELRRLDAVLDRAEQGRPQVVLVAGDAGVGKTRLLLALGDRAGRRGMRVLAGGCVELGDIGLAYLPVVDALRGLADDPEEAELLAGAAATAPGLARLLPRIDPAGPVGGLAGDGLDQLQVLDAVRAVLVGRSERSPVVLVLEDLHWADRATRDLVAFLARTLRAVRVTLAVSYRSDELHRRHPLRPLLAELVRLPGVERLALAPFGRTELAEHLEAITGGPLPADQIEGIYARSEGNPFYAEQLLAAGEGDALALPGTLAEVLLARVQRLSEPAQQVLGLAAVAGRGVPHRLLAEVAGQPEAELEQGLHEAVGAGVLATDAATGGYAFRHALLQEAVYGDLLPGEPVRLHAAYARRLAADPGGAAAELAHHCLASHDLVGALAASVRAAEQATAVLAPAEALRHLGSALRLWERVADPAAVAGTDRVELTLRAAAAASAAGELRRAASLAQDAADATDATVDPEQAARAHDRLGLSLFDAGRIEDALAARARAVELVPERPPTRLRARVAAAMAQVLVNSRRPEEARHWCEVALAAARDAGSADDEADVAGAQSVTAIAEWAHRHPPAGAGCARRPPRRPHPVGRAGRGYHPPGACPRGPNRAGGGARNLARRPRPPRPSSPAASAAGGGGRRQDPARRQTRRWPAGPSAGRDGPRHPCGAGPTPGRRRPGRGPWLPAAAGRPGPCRRGGHRRRAAHPPGRRRVPGDRQAGPLPAHRQGQPAHAAGPL